MTGSRLRGGRPQLDFLNLNMLELGCTDMGNFNAMWRACSPKLQNVQFGVPLIMGTSGNDNNTDRYRELFMDEDSRVPPPPPPGGLNEDKDDDDDDTKFYEV